MIERVKKTTFWRTGIAAMVGGLLFVGLGASACGPTAEETARNEAQSKKATGQTLEKTNLEKKREREENPNAIGYVYLVNESGVLGYYVTKGKISSNGSQLTPEDDNMWTCYSSTSTCEAIVVDGAQDDGSYGAGDPGVFFFLADDTKVVWNGDILHSDRPIPALNVPLLGGTA